MITGAFWTRTYSSPCAVCRPAPDHSGLLQLTRNSAPRCGNFLKKCFSIPSPSRRAPIFHIVKSCFMIDFHKEVPHSFRRGNPSSYTSCCSCGPPPMETEKTSRPLPGAKPWRVPRCGLENLCLSPWSYAQPLFNPKHFVRSRNVGMNHWGDRHISRQMHKTPIFGSIQLNTHAHISRHVYEEHIYHFSYLPHSGNL